MQRIVNAFDRACVKNRWAEICPEISAFRSAKLPREPPELGRFPRRFSRLQRTRSANLEKPRPGVNCGPNYAFFLAPEDVPEDAPEATRRSASQPVAGVGPDPTAFSLDSPGPNRIR